MRDILGCVRSALRHVGCSVDGARLNAAHGDGGGENDRKERFMVLRYSLPPDRMRLLIVHRGRIADSSFQT